MKFIYFSFRETLYILNLFLMLQVFKIIFFVFLESSEMHNQTCVDSLESNPETSDVCMVFRKDVHVKLNKRQKRL